MSSAWLTAGCAPLRLRLRSSATMALIRIPSLISLASGWPLVPITSCHAPPQWCRAIGSHSLLNTGEPDEFLLGIGDVVQDLQRLIARNELVFAQDQFLEPALRVLDEVGKLAEHVLVVGVR